MVFLFFENIQRTPSPGFAPCQSPRGVYPQAPKTPPQARETVNPYKTYTHAQKPRETPHNAATTQAGHNDTNNRTTNAAGHDERRTQCTHAHERHKPGTRLQAFKACHVHPGRPFLIIFYVYRAAVHARKSPGI